MGDLKCVLGDLACAVCLLLIRYLRLASSTAGLMSWQRSNSVIRAERPSLPTRDY